MATTIGLSGCQKAEPPQIVFGALLPITGDLSYSGETVNASLEIAAKDINHYLADVGIKTRVELIVENTNTEPETAKEKLGELADKGVKLVIGPGSSAEIKAIAAMVSVSVASPAIAASIK